MSLTIKELQSREEIMSAFPMIKQLRTHLNEGSYLELVIEAREKEDYKCLPFFIKKISLQLLVSSQ